MIRIRGPDAAGRIGDRDTRRSAERRFTSWRKGERLEADGTSTSYPAGCAGCRFGTTTDS